MCQYCFDAGGGDCYCGPCLQNPEAGAMCNLCNHTRIMDGEDPGDPVVSPSAIAAADTMPSQAPAGSPSSGSGSGSGSGNGSGSGSGSGS